MLWLKDHGKPPLPGGSVLISPGTDFTELDEKKRAALDHLEDLKLSEDYETYRMYVGDADVRDPYISPIFGDFSGTSPVLVQYGSTEFFAEDGEKIVPRLMADEVDVTTLLPVIHAPCVYSYFFISHLTGDLRGKPGQDDR